MNLSFYMVVISMAMFVIILAGLVGIVLAACSIVKYFRGEENTKARRKVELAKMNIEDL